MHIWKELFWILQRIYRTYKGALPGPITIVSHNQRRVNISVALLKFLFLSFLNRKVKVQVIILSINSTAAKAERSMRVFYLHLSNSLSTIIESHSIFTSKVPFSHHPAGFNERNQRKYWWVCTHIKKWLNKWRNGIKQAIPSYRSISSCIGRYSLL